MDTERDGVDAFVTAMLAKGFVLDERHSPSVAPAAFKANPLTSGDDDACSLHFRDLSHDYLLYRFVRAAVSAAETTPQ